MEYIEINTIFTVLHQVIPSTQASRKNMVQENDSWVFPLRSTHSLVFKQSKISPIN